MLIAPMRSRHCCSPWLCRALRGAPAVTIGLPSPAELGQVWDRTRLPLPLPPLMRHPDVVAAIEAARHVRSGPVPGGGDRGRRSRAARSTTSGSVEARCTCCCGRRCTATSPPRRSRSSTSSTTSRRTARLPHVARMLDRLTLHVVPMLNPDGAETATATQRAGHRHQPRRAAAADAGGARAQGAARPRQPAHRLQPAQPELAHVGRQDGQAGGDVAARRVVRRGA